MNPICTKLHKAQLIALSIILIVSFTKTNAQVLPKGFQLDTVARGIYSPSAMAFAPDGRLFICSEGGNVLVLKNGAILSRPFTNITVDSSGERGMLGITFDPFFKGNGWVYFYYTLPDGSRNRIVRIKAGGDTAIAGSTQILLNLDTLNPTIKYHNGGAMRFGKDNRLYVCTGDNGNGNNSQDLTNYTGKVLRINSNGSIPPGNPYTTGNNETKRIWCYGLRSPFSMDIDPASGKILVDDVGQSTWEEINDATASGKNFGWPLAEGNSSNPALTNPIYEYNHDGAHNITGCAITGGSFFNPANTNYPAYCKGSYFFLDLCHRWIDRIIFNDSVTEHNFAANSGGGNVALTTGPDGNLYFLSRNDEALYKITYQHKTASAIETTAQQQPSKKIMLYPSPANSELTIVANGFNTNKLVIKIYNASGLLEKSFKMGNVTTINTSTLSGGIYFIAATDGAITEKDAFEILH